MTLSLRDTARALRVPEATVFEWIRARRLPTCGREGEVLVNETALREWALATGTPLDVAALPGDGGRATELRVSLADAVTLGGLLVDVEGERRMDVLRDVLARVALPEGEDRTFVTEMVLAREALFSTAVGNGIALPHARTPVVVRLDRPMVTLAYPRTPVPFDAPDGLPVHALFMLLSPSVGSHLQVLGLLAHALRDPKVTALLRRKAPLDDVVAALRVCEERS